MKFKMKHGFRKPSLKKSIAARTVGRAKRNLMKSIIPGYGTRHSSIFNPSKKAYNKIYSRTTLGINDIVNTTSKANNSYTKTTNNLSKNISNINTKYLELDISMNDPNVSFYRTIVKEVEKLDRQSDCIKFFVTLKSINSYILKLEEFENMYGNYNHYLSNKLTIFMNNNKRKIISDFIDRNYRQVYEKITNLKTQNAKTNNIHQYLAIYNNFESELSEENKFNIKQNYNNLLKLL